MHNAMHTNKLFLTCIQEPAPEKKKEKKQHLEYYEQQKNEKLEKIVKEYNSAKRPESLLKAHQKELKRKQVSVQQCNIC